MAINQNDEEEEADLAAAHTTNTTKKDPLRRVTSADCYRPMPASGPRFAMEATTSTMGTPSVRERVFSDPAPPSGWESMQQEIALLRKAVQEMHRNTDKQTKQIDELKAHLQHKAQLLREREGEISTLKQRCSKQQDVLNAVEGSVLCQICMEPPIQPYVLSPCGHVLCMSCLQEWFKTSSGNQEEYEDEARAQRSVLAARKTCPCCRTAVRHRPTPVFMIKAVTGALLKEKEAEAAPREHAANVSPAVSDDPWKGIFPDSDADANDLEEEEGDSESGEESNDDDRDDWALRRGRRSAGLSWYNDSEDEDEADFSMSGRHAEYDSTSSEGESDGPGSLVAPRWEPTSVQINPQDYPLTGLDGAGLENAMSLLRRGCSWAMIQRFSMSYTHAQGIVVSLASIDDSYQPSPANNLPVLQRVFLGWNVLLDNEDSDGERYMHSVLFDIRNRPERWRVSPADDGSLEIRRLVNPEERDGYCTSDSDIWPSSDSADSQDSDDD